MSGQVYQFKEASYEEAFVKSVSKHMTLPPCPPDRLERVEKIVREMIFLYGITHPKQAYYLVHFDLDDREEQSAKTAQSDEPPRPVDERQQAYDDELDRLCASSDKLLEQIKQCQIQILSNTIAQYKAILTVVSDQSGHLSTAIDIAKANIKVLSGGSATEPIA